MLQWLRMSASTSGMTNRQSRCPLPAERRARHVLCTFRRARHRTNATHAVRALGVVAEVHVLAKREHGHGVDNVLMAGGAITSSVLGEARRGAALRCTALTWMSMPVVCTWS